MNDYMTIAWLHSQWR